MIDDDRAIGVTYCTADHVVVCADGRHELLAWLIRYLDELVRDGDSWGITARKLIVDWEEVRPLARVWRDGALVDAGGVLEDERVTIAQTVYKYATGIDSRDWDLHRSIFVDEVEMDFESWNGVPSQTIRVDDLKANVRIFFAGLDVTQHSTSNPTVTIDGNRTRRTVYMQAEHFLNDRDPARRYVIGGYYTDGLERGADGQGRLISVKLTVLWEAGDRSFMADAGERGVAKLRGA